MIIAQTRRSTPRPSLSTSLAFISSRSERRASRCFMPELCLSYAPRCRGPRSSPHRVGSEVGSPTPLLVPSPTALLALTLGLPRSPLARSVVSAGILVRPDRADVAASPSFGVGGMQAYVTSAVPLRDSRPTGSNDSRSLSARSLATRDSSRSSLNTSRCV